MRKITFAQTSTARPHWGGAQEPIDHVGKSRPTNRRVCDDRKCLFVSLFSRILLSVTF